MQTSFQLGVQLIDFVTAAVVALVAATVFTHHMVLPSLSTMYTDPSPGSAVPAEFYWHCPMRIGTASAPSVGVLIPATPAEWLRLPALVHAPQFPQDVSAVANASCEYPRRTCMELHMCYKWPALHAVFSDSCPRWQGLKSLWRLTHVFRCTYAVANPPREGLLTQEQKVQHPNMLCTLVHHGFV